MLKYHNWLRSATYEKENQRNRDLVAYNNSMKAKEYIDSVFFKLSLIMCESFTFIQNQERKNESTFMFKDHLKNEDKFAGAKLLE